MRWRAYLRKCGIPLALAALWAVCTDDAPSADGATLKCDDSNGLFGGTTVLLERLDGAVREVVHQAEVVLQGLDRMSSGLSLGTMEGVFWYCSQ